MRFLFGAVLVVLALMLATIVNYFVYDNYWHRTIRHAETVEMNIMRASFPAKLSLAIQHGDAAEVQRVLDSAYGFFGVVVTDGSKTAGPDPGQKILYLSKGTSNWKKGLNAAVLEGHDFDLLRTPAPHRTEARFATAYAEKSESTGARNQGRVIGRVYYVRNQFDSYREDLAKWVKKPFDLKSGRIFTYTAIYAMFLVIGVLAAVIFQMYRTRKALQIRQLEELRDENRIKLARLDETLTNEKSRRQNLLGEIAAYREQLAVIEPENRKHVEEMDRRIAQLVAKKDAADERVRQLEADVLSEREVLQAMARHLPGGGTGQSADTAFLTPSEERFTVGELRERIGLAQLVKGKVTKVEYHDRYLKDRSANILDRILAGEWITPDTHVVVHVWEGATTIPRQEFRQILANSLVNIHLATKHVTIKLLQEKHMALHQRRLDLTREDGRTFRFLFDAGMDFARVDRCGKYYIHQETYIVRVANPV